MNFKNQPDCMSHILPLQKKQEITGETIHSFMFKDFNYDPTLAPEGQTVVQVMYTTRNFDYWPELGTDRDAYKKEKARILGFTISELEASFPGITKEIEQTYL